MDGYRDLHIKLQPIHNKQHTKLGIAEFFTFLRKASQILSKLNKNALKESGKMLCLARASGSLKTPMTTTRVSKSHYLVLFSIIVLGAALRLHYIEQPMRYDEALTYLRYASQPLPAVVSSYNEPNNHVFHSVLVHAAYTVFGNDPAALRLPALIAGVLLIPAAYWTSRRFFQPRAGLLAAGLCAVSLPLVEFSVNARGYTLLALFSILLLGVVKLLKDRATARRWLAFIVLSALGFYTIPVMLYPFGIAAAWLVLSYRRDQKGWQFLKRLIVLGAASAAAAGLTLLLYSPIIAVAGIGALTQNQFVARPEAYEFYQRLTEVLGTLFGFPLLGFPPLIAAVLLAGVALAMALHRRISGVGISPGWAALAWLLPVLFIQRVIPFDRTWTAITPLALMLAAAGIAYLVGRSDKVFTAALLLLTIPAAVGWVQSGDVTSSARTGYAPDAEAAALWLGENGQPDDVVLIPTPLDEPVRYYLNYHDYPEIDIRNQHQVYWIDLLQDDAGTIYVFGAPPDDIDGLIETFTLPAPSFEASLETAATFSQTTLQALALPGYPAGTLYADDFEGDGLFSGWTLNNLQAVLTKAETNNQALRLTTAGSLGEMNLSGALDWRDYAVEVRLQVVTPGSEGEDVYLHLRSTADVGSYIAGIDIEQGHAFIAGDLNRQWRGLLAEAEMPFEAERWYTLRFVARGNAVSLDVDGEPIISIEDDAAQAGAVRLLISPNSQVLIDDLRITALSE